MPALARVLPWFRQITGETVNSLIDAVNNLTGFGTAAPVVATTITFTGQIEVLSTLSVNGAIPPSTPATYVITKAGVLADTLAAPVTGTDDGKIITVTSATANAHTITATGLLQTGAGANANLATFAAQPGAGLTLMAYQAKWYVLASVGITFS
jgi:hypothetical protein